MAPEIKDFRMKKTRRVEIRFSDYEYEKLAAIADKSDLNVSEVVRKSATRTKTLTLDSKRAQLAKIREVGKIGNNLNQIARWVNTHKSGADALQVLAHLQAIRDSLKEI